MDDDEQLRTAAVVDAPWRYRGRDLGRILAFSDGVFAFAATLLVLGLLLPAGTQGSAVRPYLLSSRFLTSLYAYVIAFFVIALWWQGHHLIFQYLERFDRPLVRWNTIFLIFIAVMPFTTTVLNSSGTDPIGPVLFSAVQLGAGATLAFTWHYATRRGALVRPGLPEPWIRYVLVSTLLPPVFFAAAIPIAFVDARLAELVWLGLLVVPPLTRRTYAR